jgi:hypothetical protein
LNEKTKGILADTTVWIEFFRTRSKTGDTLESLIREGSVWLCGPVLFEILQGVRTEEEKSNVLDMLSDLPYIEMSQSLWQKASEISASFRKKGLNLPLSDILIAAVALRNNLSVFTLDKHFEQIPGVKIHRT